MRQWGRVPKAKKGRGALTQQRINLIYLPAKLPRLSSAREQQT
jgi:hypothetical protein